MNEKETARPRARTAYAKKCNARSKPFLIAIPRTLFAEMLQRAENEGLNVSSWIRSACKKELMRSPL